MPAFLRRISGVLLILLALAGLIASIFCLWQVISLKDTALQRIESGLDLVEESIHTTNQALDAVESTLDAVSTNISSMRSALLTLAQSVSDAKPILGSLSTLTGKTLPDTLTATQASLVTAQTTAKTIEDILGLITRIPLMPGDPYDPEVPLYISLRQVVTDLDKIQPQLNTMEGDLADASTNLNSLESDIIQVSQDLLTIHTNLADAVEVVHQYQGLTNDLQTGLDSVRLKLPNWLSILTGFVSFVLFWLVIYQLDLTIRGIKLIRA